MSSPRYPLNSKDLLYFLHIPKTAGMTFTDFIKGQFAASESNSAVFISEFLKTPRTEIEHYKFIAGHLFYNIDDFVKRNLVYITMLRDPVERTISHYAHLRRLPSPTAYEFIKSMSLLEFASDPRTQFLYANLQTRYIGINQDFPAIIANFNKGLYNNTDLREQVDGYPSNDFVPDELLQRAKERLSQFAFVGLTEQFDESLLLLSHTFGWRAPEVTKVINVGTNRPNEDAISPEAIAIIREHTQLDSALYEAGKQLFLERYAQIANKPAEKTIEINDDQQAVIAALQRKIDFQQRAINQLGEELATIQNSFGWRFVLRVHAARQKLMPQGSPIEKWYLKLRGR